MHILSIAAYFLPLRFKAPFVIQLFFSFNENGNCCGMESKINRSLTLSEILMTIILDIVRIFCRPLHLVKSDLEIFK